MQPALHTKMGMIPMDGVIASMVLEERTCLCGCGRTFKVLPASSERFASFRCKENHAGGKVSKRPGSGWRQYPKTLNMAAYRKEPPPREAPLPVSPVKPPSEIEKQAFRSADQFVDKCSGCPDLDGLFSDCLTHPHCAREVHENDTKQTSNCHETVMPAKPVPAEPKTAPEITKEDPVPPQKPMSEHRATVARVRQMCKDHQDLGLAECCKKAGIPPHVYYRSKAVVDKAGELRKTPAGQKLAAAVNLPGQGTTIDVSARASDGEATAPNSESSESLKNPTPPRQLPALRPEARPSTAGRVRAVVIEGDPAAVAELLRMMEQHR